MEEKNSHKKKKNTYKSSNIFEHLLSDNDKKDCAKIFDEIQNSLQDFEFDIDKYGIEIKNTLKNFNIEDWCHKFSDKIQ